jgi:hypothetical protein
LSQRPQLSNPKLERCTRHSTLNTIHCGYPERLERSDSGAETVIEADAANMPFGLELRGERVDPESRHSVA